MEALDADGGAFCAKAGIAQMRNTKYKFLNWSKKDCINEWDCVYTRVEESQLNWTATSNFFSCSVVIMTVSPLGPPRLAARPFTETWPAALCLGNRILT